MIISGIVIILVKICTTQYSLSQYGVLVCGPVVLCVTLTGYLAERGVTSGFYGESKWGHGEEQLVS